MIINCDLVMTRDFKTKRSLIVKSCGATVYNREIHERKEGIVKVS